MKKNDDKNKLNSKITNILFILTILSIFASTLTTSSLVGNNIFLLEKYNYIHYIFLIIPIVTLVLSIIFREDSAKLRRNIIICIIVIVLLVSMANSKSPYKESKYDDILEYKEVLDINLPEKGNAMTVERENSKYIYVLFKKDDVSILYDEIKENEHWLSAETLRSELTIFLNPVFVSGSKNNYFLIYNKTTGEYNKLPDESGEYEIFTAIFSSDKNIMEIDTFTYNFVS